MKASHGLTSMTEAGSQKDLWTLTGFLASGAIRQDPHWIDDVWLELLD